jgi:hypothetical protein
MTSNLTPADLGILAAAFDATVMMGYGDDDSVAHIAHEAIYEAGIAEADAWSVAYDFFRAQFSR